MLEFWVYSLGGGQPVDVTDPPRLRARARTRAQQRRHTVGMQCGSAAAAAAAKGLWIRDKVG